MRSVPISRKTPRKGDMLRAVGYGMKGLWEGLNYLKNIELNVSRTFAKVIKAT